MMTLTVRCAIYPLAPCWFGLIAYILQYPRLQEIKERFLSDCIRQYVTDNRQAMSSHLVFAELALSIAHPSLQSSYMEEDNCKWH